MLLFGLAAVDHAGDVRPGWIVRWYGWLRYCNELAAVVVGPYPDAAAAADDAAPTIDELRLGQLSAPTADPTWSPDARVTDTGNDP